MYAYGQLARKLSFDKIGNVLLREKKKEDQGTDPCGKIKGQTLAEWDWRSRNFVGTGPSAEGVGKVSLG